LPEKNVPILKKEVQAASFASMELKTGALMSLAFDLGSYLVSKDALKVDLMDEPLDPRGTDFAKRTARQCAFGAPPCSNRKMEQRVCAGPTTARNADQ
jgi:hypothetical protein